MHANQERGIAIVLALFLTSVLSVLAASLMFLSQTETYASMNYRMMSQTRYAAEAGIQKASHFLLDSSQYPMPGTVTDPLSNYNRAVSPVTYMGQPVILSATVSQSNYPVAAVRTAFSSAAQGTLTAANATLGYTAYAKLMSMQVFDSYGGGQQVVQTWQITANGSLSGPRSAIQEVVASVETPKVPANSYAAFATATTCDAIYFHGNVTVDSYDSRLGPPTGAGNSTLTTGGNLGTNGNVHIQGSVDVEGNLYTPRSGVGDCTSGAITGLSEGGSASVTGSMVQLPSVVTYPLPVMSATPPTTLITLDNTEFAKGAAQVCLDLGLVSGTNCTVNTSSKIVTVDGHGSDLTLPSVAVPGGSKVILQGSNPPNNVNINSLTGSGDVEVNANLTSVTENQSVVLKVAGKNPDGSEMTVPFDLSTMSWKQNSAVASYDASALQIVYGGSATINMKGGNSQSAVTVYAPNAAFELQGTQDLFGSVLARTIANAGNASIHYDRRLTADFWVAGKPMLSAFSWKRF